MNKQARNVRNSRSFCSLAVLVSVLLAQALMAEEPKVSFYLPLDGTLVAVKALGNPQPTSASTNPEFAPGIRGQGLVIGTDSGTAGYDVARNIAPERGTITFWLRQIEPDKTTTDRTWYTVMNFGGEDGYTLLYKWEWYGSLVLLSKPYDSFITFPPYDTREWHFFAVTWDEGIVRFFLDGEQVAENTNFRLPPFKGGFGIGGAGATAKRILDELTIYAEPIPISEIKRLYREVGKFASDVLLTIPFRESPITIDGKIDESEWGEACIANGFVRNDTGLAAPGESRAYLTYDDEALYVAFESEIPKKVREDPHMTAGITGILRRKVMNRDEDVYADDSFEVDIFPDIASDEVYGLVANALDTHLDTHIAAGASPDTSWNPEWQTRGSLDMNAWRVEARIPFASFPAGKPGPGSAWGLNLIRHWQLFNKGSDQWAWGMRRRDGKEVKLPRGKAVFAGKGALVSRLVSTGDVLSGDLKWKAEVLNASGSDKEVGLSLRTDSPEISIEEKWLIPAGKSKALELSKRLENPATSTISFELLDVERKELILKQVTSTFLEQVFEMKTASYPSIGIVRLDFDLGLLRERPLKTLGVSAFVTKKGEKTPLIEKEIKPLESYRQSLELDISKLEVGQYEIHCQVKHPGKIVGEKVISYQKKPLPEWYGNTIGISDKVPRPFVPIVREADTVTVWGREYRFEGLLFPKQILTKGEPILSAPIRLVIGDGEGDSYSSSEGTCELKWTKTSETRLEFEAAQKIGAVSVKTSSWMEYDGFIWTKLEVSPSPGASLKEVRLEIPFNKEYSELINPYDYGVRTSGLLKIEGWKGTVRPVWLGNGTGGLQWMSPTDLTWNVKTPQEEVAASPGESGATLRMTFVDKPLEVGEPLIVEFGLVATPTRPPAPEYRKFNWNAASLAPSYSWYEGGDVHAADPSYARGGLYRTSDDERAQMISSGPYVITNSINAHAPDAEYWADEWTTSAGGRVSDGWAGWVVSPASASFRDYFVWWYREQYRRSRFVGLYYDASGESQDSNIYHGSGVRKGGKALPITNTLGSREITKRMYTMMRELEPERTMVIYHNSGMVNLAFLSFVDVYADGENFTSILTQAEPDYHKHFPPDAFRAQSMGHNFGPTNWILDEFNRSQATKEEDWKRLGTQPVDHFFGLILLHDSTYWMAYGIKEGYDHTIEALRKYNFDDRYRFIPYWKQKVVELPEEMFASFFVDDEAKRTILILLNNTEEDHSMRLKVDWKALGYDDWKNLTVDDPVFKVGGKIENGELLFPVTRVSYRMIVINPSSGK